MTARVGTDDLELAATWLESYEAGPEDENGEALEKVAAWLRAEVQRREDHSRRRSYAREHGVPLSRVRITR